MAYVKGEFLKMSFNLKGDRGFETGNLRIFVY